MRKMVLLFLLGLTCLLLSSCKNNSEEEIYITTPIGISFPRVTSKRQQEKTIKHLKELSIDKVKIEAHWTFIEQEKGLYSFENLDSRINMFLEHDIEVFLMVSYYLPDIYSTKEEDEIRLDYMAEFESFVTALVSRYKDDISKIQFGNEWDNPKNGYQNSADDYIAISNVFYDIVKDINSDIDVVLGGMTTGYLYYILFTEYGMTIDPKNRKIGDIDEIIERFIDQMSESIKDGHDRKIMRILSETNYDIADLHLYDNAELFDELIAIFSSMIDSPILVSEYGAPNPDYEGYTKRYHRDRIKIILETIDNLGLLEIYHFSLYDHKAYHAKNGLLTRFGMKKPVYYLYKNRIE